MPRREEKGQLVEEVHKGYMGIGEVAFKAICPHAHFEDIASTVGVSGLLTSPLASSPSYPKP